MLTFVLSGVLVLAAPDNNVEWSGVSHIAFQDRRPLCPTNGHAFDVLFQTWQNDLTAARVQADDGTVSWIPAAPVSTRGPYDVWSATIPFTSSDQVSYWIEVTDGTDVDYYSVSGPSEDPPADGGFVVDFATLSHAPYGASRTFPNGVVFRVWAPGATGCTLRGDFNNWGHTPTTALGDDWIVHVLSAQPGDEYKWYFNSSLWKPDARARALNASNNLNSVVVDPLGYPWVVEDFATPALEELVLYELHTGTFSGLNDPVGTPPFPGGFVDLADRMAHLADLGINGIMLMPITEFPFDESAGYNPISQWAPEWAYGQPDELRELVDVAHQHGIAVLLDIVWNHFSSTDNFLWFYDSTQIYFDDPAVGTPWGDQADFDHPMVQDYFAHSALLFLEEYKVDGFRMDATDFMNMGEHTASGWALMQRLNDEVDWRWASKIVIAEQLPDDAAVTRPTNLGGAGFDAQYYDNFTDRLREEILDAAFGDPEMWKIRNIINGSGAYLSGKWVVNYVELHDEVWPTSGGERLVRTIDPTPPHDDIWARGRVKLAQGVTLTAPGVPAMFMASEWLESKNFGTSSGDRIDWAKKITYAGVFEYFQDLVHLRKTNPALRADAFHNVHHLNESSNVIGWQRTDFGGQDVMMVANFSNTTYHGYRIGVPVGGDWVERINSEGTKYGEAGPDNPGSLASEAVAADGFSNSILVEVPAHSFLVFQTASSVVGAPVTPGAAPAGLDLARITPNPASGARSLEFTLPAPGLARLEILDVAGRRVATVVEGERPAGRQRANWDGRDARGDRVAAGVYLVRLESAGEVVTRKLTVLR